LRVVLSEIDSCPASSESTIRNHVANILTKLQQRAQIEPAT